jgi:hypothetical protein
VLIALGIRAAKQWRIKATSPPLIGLTATPWRSKDKESEALRRLFHRNLLRPSKLGASPVRSLQDRKILAEVKSRKLSIRGTKPMTARQQKKSRNIMNCQVNISKCSGVSNIATEKL